MGNQGFWFSEYEWLDEEREPNKGPGFQMTLEFHGSSARVSIDFPFDLESGIQLIRDIIDELEADYWRRLDPGSEWFASSVFERFPFLREQLPSTEELPHRLRGEAARDAAKDWSRKRLHSILLELGPERGPALDLDFDEAVRDLAHQVEEAILTDEATQGGARDVSAATESPSPEIEATLSWAASSQIPGRGAGAGPSLTPDATRDEPQDSFWRLRPHAAPAAISTIMLFLALGDHPYGFYTSLRWIVFASALGVSYVLHEWNGTHVGEPVGREVGLVVFIGLAILFNPVVPVTLERGTWAPIDYFGALVFALVAFGLKRPSSATSR
ncbi:DUF6804 family protein [Pedococcus bigeumensis]|uniref:Uncharacterized protein n=1 Tax=Pedococcus bigeumensis TaxID=433644 RepID=A0A502CN34_9MICO|nr:DUF6804 family protein [Pedococcus bigeumensis]TPG14044.1 hypothetical protein EAH86_17730 [Pedococcus bigeumensis]